MLHVWNIYLHLPHKWPQMWVNICKYIYIYYTWSIWELHLIMFNLLSYGANHGWSGWERIFQSVFFYLGLPRWFQYNVGKTIMNHPPVITSIGGINLPFTVMSGKNGIVLPTLIIYKSRSNPHVFWLNPIKPAFFMVKPPLNHNFFMVKSPLFQSECWHPASRASRQRED